MARKAMSPILFGVPPEQEWPERYTPFRCPSLRNISTAGSASLQHLIERQSHPFRSFGIQSTSPSEYFKPGYKSKSSYSLRITPLTDFCYSRRNASVPPQTAPALRASTCLSPYGLRNMSRTDQVIPMSPDLQRSAKKDEEEKECRSSGKLMWVDLLNQWISEDKVPMPYLSFVNNAPTEEKWLTHRQEFRKKKKTEDEHSLDRKVHSTPYTPYSLDKKVQFQDSQPELRSIGWSLSLEHQHSLSHLAWDSDRELTEVLSKKQMSDSQINVSEIEEDLVLPMLEEEKIVSSPEKSYVCNAVDEDSSDEGEQLGWGTIRVAASDRDRAPPPSSSLHTTGICSSSHGKIDTGMPTYNPIKKNKKKTEKPLTNKCSGKSRENQEKQESLEKEEDHLLHELSYIQQKTTIIKHQIVKKERVQPPKKVIKETVTENRLLPTLPEVKKTTSWIYSDEGLSSDEEQEKSTEITVVDVDVVIPALNLDIESVVSPRLEDKKRKIRKKSVNSVNVLISRQKKIQRKPLSGIQGYNDDLEHFQKGEECRKKQQVAIKRHKSNKLSRQRDEEEDLGIPQFEDNGFLSRYCIFNRVNMEMYKCAFDAVDETRKGWLNGTDVMIALKLVKGVNSKLTETTQVYLYRVLELVGFRVTDGADFKLFSVLSALSVKLSSLDMWMKNIIDNMDFKALDMKMFKCKKLWECNVDKSINKISLDQLCIELRAGGVSLKHELEVRENLGYMVSLDLLDFLTYIPLFIMIHMSVVGNPFDESRNK